MRCAAQEAGVPFPAYISTFYWTTVLYEES